MFTHTYCCFGNLSVLSVFWVATHFSLLQESCNFKYKTNLFVIFIAPARVVCRVGRFVGVGCVRMCLVL